MTRVLLIAPFAPCGGGMGRIMAYLAASGAGAGVEFEMVESRGGGSVAGSAWHVLRAAVRIIVASAADDMVIVHLNFGEGGSVVRKGFLLLLADGLGLPTVLHLHASDILSFHARLRRLPRGLMAIVFRRARSCIVLGPLWQHWLVERLGVASSRITIVHNGVPQPLVARPAQRGDMFTLVFLGNLLARKGLPDLLHALASLPDSAPAGLPPWRLLVAGGGDAAPLHSLSRQLGLSGAVHFLGWCERAATTDILGQANALVLPSYFEALPLVLLEAASLGVPAVATRVGAVPDVFTDGLDALLVSAGDRLGLASALGLLMRDAAFARRIGDNARRLYERRFSMEIFVSGMAKIYAGLGAVG